MFGMQGLPWPSRAARRRTVSVRRCLASYFFAIVAQFPMVVSISSYPTRLGHYDVTALIGQGAIPASHDLGHTARPRPSATFTPPSL